MKVLVVIGFIFSGVLLAQDAVLVLTNAQTIEIQGSYEVKGNYVVFTDVEGELNQLPKKLVDLEATDRKNAEKPADKLVVQADDVQPGERNFSSVSSRLNADKRSESISLSDSDLNRFARSHPGNSSDQQPTERRQEYRFEPPQQPETPASPATTDLKTLQRSFQQELAAIDARIRELDEKIKDREEQLLSVRPNSSNRELANRTPGYRVNELDDEGREIPDSSALAKQVSYDSQLSGMKFERERLVKERQAVIAKARAAGVRNLR